MPSGKQWAQFIYINLAFVIYISFSFFASYTQEIQNNWPVYRCNPLYMPLSKNIETDFVYCVQNMQSSYMGYLLQPLTFITSSLGTTLSGFMGEINAVRGMFNKIRTFISSTIQSVFGVFLNLVIEFQKITIGIKDLLGKTIGIMVTLMYMLDGSMKTMGSAWNGPSGQLVRSLGKCFHPDTLLELLDGRIVPMKDIELGAVLKDGSIVEAVMRIQNRVGKRSPLYKITGSGVQGKDIYVTGSHLIYDPKGEKVLGQGTSFMDFRQVEESFKAEKTEWVIDEFSCLITNTHMIPIGKEVFWDWEDALVKLYLQEY